ncbi:hypothetical protein P8452_08280 [Trifolium repens]|nr:hypothetical protein P8452_08280 [Trifolium repens]
MVGSGLFLLRGMILIFLSSSKGFLEVVIMSSSTFISAFNRASRIDRAKSIGRFNSSMVKGLQFGPKIRGEDGSELLSKVSVCAGDVGM